MKVVPLSAGLIAAALAVGAPSARAADLDYGPVGPGRYSAYEDPRYRDIYGPPGVYSEERRIYREVPSVPVPPASVYAPRRYGYDDYNACLPREEIKRRLVSEGWRGFHDLEMRERTALVKARRPSGDLYELRVDRCSGEIVKAQLLGRGGYGPYAYDGARRYDRPYY